MEGTVAFVCVICRIFVGARDIFHRVPIFAFTRFRGRKAYIDQIRVEYHFPRASRVSKHMQMDRWKPVTSGPRLAAVSPETPCVATLNNTRAYFSIAHIRDVVGAAGNARLSASQFIFDRRKRQRREKKRRLYKFELSRETNPRRGWGRNARLVIKLSRTARAGKLRKFASNIVGYQISEMRNFADIRDSAMNISATRWLICIVYNGWIQFTLVAAILFNTKKSRDANAG